MSKIDIDKFVAQLCEYIAYMDSKQPNIPYNNVTYAEILIFLRDTLKSFNLQYKNGEIVEIEPEKESFYLMSPEQCEKIIVNSITERMLEERPIPTLKGKEKADFEREFNRFKQICGFINWPAREEIYKKVILWFIAWSRNHLNIGNINNQDEVDEPKQDEDTKVYHPTPFDDKLYALVNAACILTDNSRKFFILEHSKDLLDLVYKQFKQDQLNQEFATFTRQEFNDAVNEEIKRRCEVVDVDEMFDKVPPRILKTYFDFYKKGVVDTINKLKGE